MCSQAHYCSGLVEIIRKLWEKHFGVKNLYQIRFGTEISLQFRPRQGMREQDWSDWNRMVFPHLGPEISCSKLHLTKGPGEENKHRFSQFLLEKLGLSTLEPITPPRNHLLWRANFIKKKIKKHKNENENKKKRRHFFTTPWKVLRYITPRFSFPFAIYKGSFLQESGRITEINSSHRRTCEPAYVEEHTDASDLHKRISRNEIMILFFYRFLL